MPQARLPDINTQYIKFVNKAVTSLESQNYTSCLGSLYTLNGLLPNDYRVRISTQEYNTKTKEIYYATCKNCTTETNRENIQIKQMLLSPVGSIINQTQYVEIWFCPKCKFKNKLGETEIIKERQDDPSFFKVVPNPPRKKDGVDDARFHQKFEVWFWTIMGEIAAQMAQFRDDNWTKEEVFGPEDIDTSMEEAT